MLTVPRVKHVMEKNVKLRVETIKIVCQTKDVSEDHADLFVAQTVNVAQNLFVKTEYAKLGVAPTTLVLRTSHASINNVLIHVQCQVSVDLALNVTFSTMESNAVVLKEC